MKTNSPKKQTPFSDNFQIINKEVYEQTKEIFNCIICANIHKDPLVCSSCGSIFCGDCIKTWLKSYNTCPEGCKNNDISLTEINKSTKKILDKLKLRCKFGCELPFTSYSSHFDTCDKSKSDKELKCWNCNSNSYETRIRVKSEENLVNIKTENLISKIKNTEDSIQTLDIKEKGLQLKEKLEIQTNKSFFDNQILSLEKALNEKITIKNTIEKLIKEFEKGESISELNDKIDKLKLQQENSIKTIVDSFSTNYKEKELKLNALKNQLERFKRVLKKEKKEIKFKEQTLDEHSNSIISMVKINESLIASGSGDNSIKIWDLISSKCVKTLNGHDNSIKSLARLNDNVIASGSCKCIKIWNISTGVCTKTLNGHTHFINSLIILNDLYLASGSGDQTIKIWDIVNGACVKTFVGHVDEVITVIRLNDSELVSGSEDESIKVWNIKTAVCLKTLNGHSHFVNSLIKLDSNQIASGSADKSIKIWDVQNGICIKTLLGHNNSVKNLIVINNSLIASGSEDKSVKVWDLNSGVCVKTFTGHKSFVYAIIRLNDSQIASGSKDKSIKVWTI